VANRWPILAGAVALGHRNRTDAAVGSTSSGAGRLCGSTESQRTRAKSTTLGPSRRWPVTRSEAWTASAPVALRR
jgi:hypothetical protein